MPEKLEVWSCNGCGKEFTTMAHAKNCEGGHLRSGDIKFARIEAPASSQFCYEPQELWPTFIMMKCDGKSVDGKMYQLVDTVKGGANIRFLGGPPKKPGGTK